MLHLRKLPGTWLIIFKNTDRVFNRSHIGFVLLQNGTWKPLFFNNKWTRTVYIIAEAYC